MNTRCIYCTFGGLKFVQWFLRVNTWTKGYKEKLSRCLGGQKDTVSTAKRHTRYVLLVNLSICIITYR